MFDMVFSTLRPSSWPTSEVLLGRDIEAFATLTLNHPLRQPATWRLCLGPHLAGHRCWDLVTDFFGRLRATAGSRGHRLLL